MENIQHPYLDLARIEILRRIRSKPRGTGEGTYSGTHRSRYRGSSVEFADYRNYMDGDDIRLIDWKAFARTDRYYIRLYESERNLLTYAVVDKSASMAYSGTVSRTTSKLEHACRLAAALGYLTVCEGDAFGLSLVDEQVAEHMAPGRSWPHFSRMLYVLGRARARGKTDLGPCLESVYSMINKRGRLVVFSDFIDLGDSMWRILELFRVSGFGVTLFHLVHPEELHLPEVESGRFFDSETVSAPFLAEPSLIRRVYAERVERFVQSVKANARYRGCEWHLIRTNEDPYDFLKRFLLSE